MTDENKLALLNIYEVDEEFGSRHLVCFLEPVMAGAVGIDPRAIVGEFIPDDTGEFNVETFDLNSAFIASFAEYMNALGVLAPELIQQATNEPDGWLYLVDPRYPFEQHPNEEPPTTQLIGRFRVSEEGTIVPNSFQYNSEHVLFDSESGVSGLLFDRNFYDWLHPQDPPITEQHDHQH